MEIINDPTVTPTNKNPKYATGGDRKSMAGSIRDSTISKS
jgi:hypothetical protein